MVNKTLLSIQNENVGRLKILTPTRNIQYIPMNELLVKNAQPTVKDAYMCCPNNFLPQLFGINPEYSCLPNRDEELGVIDGPWLGLIPSPLDKVIKASIEEAGGKLEENSQKAMWKLRAHQSWKEIKALILGKAAGIHKIIQAEAQRKEKRIAEKYDLEETVLKTSWKRRKRKSPHHSSKKDSMPDIKKQKLVREPQIQCNGLTCGCENSIWCPISNFRANTIPIHRKQCQRCTMFSSAMKIAADLFSSIQNNKKKSADKLISKLTASSVKLRIQYNPIMNMLKNYVPESVYFKRAKSITKKKLSEKWKRIIRVMIIVTKMNVTKGKHASKASSALLIQTNIKTISDALANKHKEIMEDTTILMKYIAEVRENKEARTQSNLNLKNKSICNNSTCPTLAQAPAKSITQPHQHTPMDNQYGIQTCATKNTDQNVKDQPNDSPVAKDTINSSTPILKSESLGTDIRTIRQEKSPTEPHCTGIGSSAIQVQPLKKGLTKKMHHIEIIDLIEEPSHNLQESHSKTDKVINDTEEEEMKCRHKLNVMSRRSWMKGEQLDLAIAVLRYEHTNTNIFIAGSGAANIIQQWNINEGWFNFARIFASSIAANRKPDGIYIIPIFSGDTSGGHWHTLTIEKNRASKRGFILDSLGTGSSNSKLVENIPNAFAPGRGSVIWSTPRSIRQQGCECGSRTISAIETLCLNQKRGVSIDESIPQATLVSSVNKDTYNQMSYRRRVANIIGRYKASMQIAIIRRRRHDR